MAQFHTMSFPLVKHTLNWTETERVSTSDVRQTQAYSVKSSLVRWTIEMENFYRVYQVIKIVTNLELFLFCDRQN